MDLLTGVVQNYAWGSLDAIPGILGLAVGEEPVAEYWMGAHHSAPADVAGTRLHDRIAAAPEELGSTSVEQFGERLPYLLKLLSAEAPLSLQAHPTRAQAEAGFARENDERVELTARERTYRDDWPKPEAIVALTPFDALCGFREPRETADFFDSLGHIKGLDTITGPLRERRGEAALQEVFLDILSLEPERRGLIDEVVAMAAHHASEPGPFGDFCRTAVDVDRHWPKDPGVLAALLLNRVTLQPGEALFLDAGNMHAYLRGTGVEIMANSDNVVRGGLTGKHINVDELVRCVEFVPLQPSLVATDAVSPGVVRYVTPAPEFALFRIDGDGSALPVPGSGARILVLVDGEATLSCADRDLPLAQGQAAYLTDADVVTFTGRATAFVAAPGV